MPNQNQSASPNYEVVGLAKSDHMPIRFDGREYDLANLSDEDAAFLLQYPEQVPYLKALNAPVTKE